MSSPETVIARFPGPLRTYAERALSSSLTRRLAKGAFWSVAGVAISRSLALLASVFIARLLGRETFGELGAVQSTIAMFQVFAGFGLGMTATKYVAEYRHKDASRVGRMITMSQAVALGTGAAAAVALFLLSNWLAVRTLAAAQLTVLLRLAAPILLFAAISGSQTGVLAGFEAFHRIAGVSAASGLAAFPLMLCGAWWGGLRGVIWALLAAQVLNCALNEHAIRGEAARHRVTLAYGGGTFEWSVLWRFSTPAVLAGSMVGPVNWACTALLVNRVHGYSEMGTLTAANQWYTAMVLLPTIISEVTLPLLSERLSDNDRVQPRALLWTTFRANAAIAFPAAALISLASSYIMRAYGSAFAGSWPTLVVTAVTAALLAVQLPVGQVIAASGRMWLGFVMNAGWASVTLGLTFALVHRGALGVAAARLGGYVVHAAWTFAFAYWFLTRRNVPSAAVVE